MLRFPAVVTQEETHKVKPDIVAPGVDIVTTAVGGSYTGVTGTSFATPFVTGSAALMMQYGIVQEMTRFFMEKNPGISSKRCTEINSTCGISE